jgi:multidrug efflux pump subunit AcrA (membrane-fusion protein)
MLVSPQMPLFIIGRLENMRVEVPVSQEILTRVKRGQPVEIRVGGDDGDAIDARVSRISPFLQEGSFSAEVEIDVPNQAGRLVPGMFVTVDIFYGQSDEATLVPTSALYEHPLTGERGVFVTSVDPATAKAGSADGPNGGLSEGPVDIPFRPIGVIAEGSQTLGIDGVQPGDWVVVIGQHLLSAQGGGAVPQARIRVVDWDRILVLQGLQREDLLRQFMEKQQQLAAGSS